MAKTGVVNRGMGNLNAYSPEVSGQFPASPFLIGRFPASPFLPGCVDVIDYMRTRFVSTLSVTICEILAIKNFARIDAYRARIVSAIPRIVSDCLRIVRPKLADTNFGRSFVTLAPFSCPILVSQWANFYLRENCFANC